MKIKLLTLLLLIFASSLFAKNIKFAWITDTHIGYKNADKNLELIVAAINKIDSIDFIAATGDITEKGMTGELESAKGILDKLTKPLYVLPGNHDTKWSESGGAKFIELWNDDKFSFTIDNSLFIGLNSAIPWRGGGGHLQPDDLIWLKDELAKSDSGTDVYFFVHHPLNEEIDNWYKASNILRNYNIKLILHGHGHENKLYQLNKIPAVMCRAAFGKKNDSDWGFNLVTIDSGYISINEFNSKGSKSRWAAIDKNKSFEIPYIDQKKFENFNAEIIWQHDLESTVSPALLTWKDKIYSISDFGKDESKITCLDTLGNIIWQNTEYGIIRSRPAIADEILAAATVNGDLFTYDANTGQPLLAIGFDEPITSQLVTINYEGTKKLMIPKATNSNAAVVLGTASGKVYCYDLETLEEIWVNKNASGMIETLPLVYQNKIIFGAWDGYVYNIDANNGWLNWKWRGNKSFYYSPAACTPVTNGKNVYVVSPDKDLTAIDLLLGKTVWEENKYNAWESIGISEIGHRIFLKAYKDRFHILSAKTGKWVKEFDMNFDTDTMPHTPIEWKGNVLFALQDGIVYKIDKNFKLQKQFFMGDCRIHTIQKMGEGYFTASNMDGKIVFFKLK
ncbi:MAG: PQQ-binding-like beta-propeller repeat protein [Ignavibacteriae bacterium]|nr:hypothetical protein [Ignavibacteriota bacterium]NOG99445.1 PQQ-binding-like beta-propeller repeat protein [Ignavibacteriota bacterium]